MVRVVQELKDSATVNLYSVLHSRAPARLSCRHSENIDALLAESGVRAQC
jgi:hypothetical protein